MSEAPHLRRAKAELFQDKVLVVRDTRSRGTLFMLRSPSKTYALVGQSVDSLLAAYAVLFPRARPFRKSGVHAAFRAPPGRHYLGWQVSRAPIETGDASRALTELVRFTAAVRGRLWVSAVEHVDTYRGLPFSSQVTAMPLHQSGLLHEGEPLVAPRNQQAPQQHERDDDSIIVPL